MEEEKMLRFLIPLNYDATPMPGGFSLRSVVEGLGGAAILFQGFQMLMEQNILAIYTTLFFQIWLITTWLVLCLIVYVRFDSSFSMLIIDLLGHKEESGRYNIKRITKRKGRK